MGEHILVVEDEITLQETLAYNLAHEGYEVETVGSGTDAVTAAFSHHPDLILLDILLPGIDGFEVCRIVRQEMSVPIIFLTARDDEIDRIVGLELGGDDYITKPFRMRELLARINARLRLDRVLRVQAGDQTTHEAVKEAGDVHSFGNMQINLVRREVLVRGEPLVLSRKEFDLLYYFSQNLGRIISRDLIIQRVWGYDFDGDNRTVDVHVRWLREKIEIDPSSPKRIVTVRNEGYRFIG